MKPDTEKPSRAINGEKCDIIKFWKVLWTIICHSFVTQAVSMFCNSNGVYAFASMVILIYFFAFALLEFSILDIQFASWVLLSLSTYIHNIHY